MDELRRPGNTVMLATAGRSSRRGGTHRLWELGGRFDWYLPCHVTSSSGDELIGDDKRQCPRWWWRAVRYLFIEGRWHWKGWTKVSEICITRLALLILPWLLSFRDWSMQWHWIIETTQLNFILQTLDQSVRAKANFTRINPSPNNCFETTSAHLRVD